MDRRGIGLLIATPILLGLGLAIFLFAKPDPSQEYEAIVAMPFSQDGHYNFDLAQQKVDRIIHFIQQNPKDSRCEDLIRNFFDTSSYIARISPSRNGETMVFAAQIRPIAKKNNIKFHDSEGYDFSILDSNDKFYDNATTAIENYLSKNDGWATMPIKTSMAIRASTDHAWRQKILDIARTTTDNRDDQNAFKLLQMSVNHIGKQWVITGKYWPIVKSFSSLELESATDLIFYGNEDSPKVPYLTLDSITNSIGGAHKRTPTQKILIVSQQSQSLKSFSDEGIKVVVLDADSPLKLLTGKYNQITLGFDKGGIHTGSFNLGRVITPK